MSANGSELIINSKKLRPLADFFDSKANIDASNIDSYITEWREKLQVPELPDPTSENELAYKPVAEDEWRTLTIPSDSVYKISLGNSLSGEFWLEVDPAVTAPKIGGVLGKVSRIWDGRGFWIYNNSAKDIALVPESYTPPEFFFWFTFQEELVLEKKSWTYLKIRGNNLVQVKFPVPDVDLSNYQKKVIKRNLQSGNINYCGFAILGSTESEPVWTVTKITVAASGTATKTTYTNIPWSSVPF